MVAKSGYRLLEGIMRPRTIPKSGYRFSEEIMRQIKEMPWPTR
jgi:DNA-binding winged helix-turn-helix (wHTH) protein